MYVSYIAMIYGLEILSRGLGDHQYVANLANKFLINLRSNHLNRLKVNPEFETQNYLRLERDEN